MSTTVAGRLGFWLLICCALQCLSLSSQASEKPAPISSIRMDVNAGWAKRFPQLKGVVRSYRVIHTIFKRAGLTVKVVEYPTKRAKLALARGDLDAHFSSGESFGSHQGQFIRSEIPVAYLSWHIYYNSNNWRATWPPDNVFKQKLGKSKMSWRSLQKIHNLNIMSANSVDSIIKMLHLNRIDYWLDYSSAEQLVTPGLLKTAEQGYAYQQLFSRTILGYFQDNSEGRQLREIYELGLIKILKQGEFNALYYENLPLKNGENSTETLDYLRREFPELEIPQQLGEI